MNKIKFIEFTMVFLLILCSCGNSAKTPKDVTESFLKSVQSFDEKAISELTAGGNIMDKGENATNPNAMDFLKSITKKMKYSVGDTTEDGETAKVKVHIENVDVSAIIQQYLMSAISGALSQQSTTLSESEQLSKMKEEIDKSDKFIQKDIEVQLKKVDNQWKIDGSENANNDLYNALTGGMLDLAKSFNKSN